MKAVMKLERGEGHIEVRDVPEPTPGPGQVKVRVKAAGICGTDIHILHDEYPNTPPVVMGHEFCGEIAEVGAGVADFRPGDRVVSEPPVSICQVCDFCRAGQYNRCIVPRRTLGVNVNGGFTSYAVMTAQRLHRIPDNVSFEAAAMTEPTAVCIHALIERTTLAAGDVVVILGPGPIGALAAQVAKAQGTTVIVCGIAEDRERLAIVSQVGVDRVVNIAEEDAAKVVSDFTRGYGADVVVDAAGAAKASEMALELAKKGGRIIQLGLPGRPIPLSLDLIALKEITLIGSFAHYWSSFERALKLISLGEINADALVSAKLPVTQWREAFDRSINRRGMKILLVPVE